MRKTAIFIIRIFGWHPIFLDCNELLMKFPLVERNFNLVNYTGEQKRDIYQILCLLLQRVVRNRLSFPPLEKSLVVQMFFFRVGL